MEMKRGKTETGDVKVSSSARVTKKGDGVEGAQAEGTYVVTCISAEGTMKWEDTIENLVVNTGKNLMLDTLLAGSAYSVVGPYMFLAGGTPGSAAATDTMATKTGWTEVGGTNLPTYTGPRKTCAFSAAASGSKTLSASLSFSMTGAGTVAGCGIVLGSGAVTTIDSTAGILLSVGAFSGGSKTVANGDTLQVSYTLSV